MNAQTKNVYYKKTSYKDIFKERLKEGGIVFALKEVVDYLLDFLIMPFLFLKKKKYFEFNKGKISYFYHKYNKAWKNSRTVEVAISLDYLRKLNKDTSLDILEVGNVLSHYINISHTVLDKYENGKDVINKDIVDFKSEKKFNIIISISTLEHVGVDDEPKDSKKALDAIKNIKSNLLKKDGKLFVTIPVNYNDSLTDFVEKNLKTKFFKTYFLKRIDIKKNLWKECRFEDVKDLHYLEGIIIFEIEQKSKLIF